MKNIFNKNNFSTCIETKEGKTIFIKDPDLNGSPCVISDITDFDFKIDNPQQKEIDFLKIDACEQDNKIERLHALTPFKTVLAPPSCLGFFIGTNHEKNRV